MTSRVFFTAVKCQKTCIKRPCIKWTTFVSHLVAYAPSCYIFFIGFNLHVYPPAFSLISQISQFTGINIEIVVNTGFNNFNETHCWANYCVEYRSASLKRWCYPETFRGYFWI